MEIYSALKRARDWHGANIVLVPLADFLHRPNDVLDDLRAETLVYNDVGAEALTEFLDEKMIWRGAPYQYLNWLTFFPRVCCAK